MKLILAADSLGGIAKQGKLPWLEEKVSDLAHFAEKTRNSYVLTGRKTALTLPSLPGREIIVVSSQQPLELAIRKCSDLTKSVWCIGGKELASSLLKKELIEEVWLTIFHKSYQCDLFLPEELMNVVTALNASDQEMKIFPSKWGTQLVKQTEYYNIHKLTPINEDARKYQELVLKVFSQGLQKENRTGVTTLSLFGGQLSFCLEGWRLPLSTLKKAFFRGIVEELLWFCAGQTSSKLLEEKKVMIWKDNSAQAFLQKSGLPYQEGDCGPIYGFQWAHWGAEYQTCLTDYSGQGINQLEWIIQEIQKNPTSRRLILSAWNVGDLAKMALPPCHVLYQFIVEEIDGRKMLSCHLYQRSSDTILAGEWNIASASLLTFLLAKITGCLPRKLVVSYGDIHIYAIHKKELIAKYLQRLPVDYPRLSFPQKEKITDYTFQDFFLADYHPHPELQFGMVV